MNRLTILAAGYAAALTGILAWPESQGRYREGIASWYGEKYRGRTTASGSIFNPDKLTAAHRTLPFGTVVRCVLGERSVDVTITDRGPFIDGRELDLSRAAFEKLAHTDAGLIKIKWKVMK